MRVGIPRIVGRLTVEYCQFAAREAAIEGSLCLSDDFLELRIGLVRAIGTQQIAGFQGMDEGQPLVGFTFIKDIIVADVIGPAGQIDLSTVQKFKHTRIDFLLLVDLRSRLYEAFLIGNVAMKVGQRGPVQGFKRLSHA